MLTREKLNKDYKLLQSSDFTQVFHNPIKKNGISYDEYIITDKELNILTSIKFQMGNFKEKGVNGVLMENLLNICVNQLECFQDSNLACKDNEKALANLEEALIHLGNRQKDRIKRKVYGTTKI